MNRWCLALLATVLALAPMVTTAQTIDVLWYAYSPPDSETQYRAEIQDLADNAHTTGSGVRWDVTFFGPDDDPPDFAAFDVLVVQSGDFQLIEDVPGNVYRGIFDNQQAIEAARGSRTLITGLDPDWDYIFVAGSPRDVLVNFVNWAGSGTGLGIVALVDDDDNWPMATNSFLRDEVIDWYLADHSGRAFIPDFAADYPINTGLADALANPALAIAPVGFHLSMPGYVAIHQTETEEEFGEFAGITMVTASEADGATTPQAHQDEFWCDGLLPPLHHPMTLPTTSRARIPVRMRLLDDMGDPVTPDDLSQPPVVQLRFGTRTRAVGPFDYQRGAGVWTVKLDSRQLSERGVHTVEAVAGDDSYEVELCEQTIRRR